MFFDVPQGSALGPLFFVVCINLMVNESRSSNLVSYADDVKIFKEISPEEDIEALHYYIDHLYDWEPVYSLLNFHPDKYVVMRIMSKFKNQLDKLREPDDVMFNPILRGEVKLPPPVNFCSYLKKYMEK